MPDEYPPIEVFCSYAQADEPLLQQLEAHLSMLKRQGLISIWHDRLIMPGTDWTQTIDAHLNGAWVILLLISSDFLASDYRYGIEMKRAMARHQTGRARVIPILLRPVDWKEAPFADLQMLPTDARPITNWSNQDEAFTDVAAGIRQTIQDLFLLWVIRRIIESLPSLSKSVSRTELSSELLNALYVLKEEFDKEDFEQKGPYLPGLELLAASDDLLNYMDSYLIERGRHAEAGLLLERALAIREQQLGPEHPKTATILNNLGLLYAKQGKYAQGESRLKRALTIREQQPEPDPLATAASLDTLGVLYENLGQLDQAEPLLKRALAIREEKRGHEHLDTAISLSNLAVLYVRQGKDDLAEPLLERSLAIGERQRPDHPDTAASLSNLGVLYAIQGKYDQAEPLLKRALAIREEKLGLRHPDTVNSHKYLALLYEGMNSAEPLPFHFYMGTTPAN